MEHIAQKSTVLAKEVSLTLVHFPHYQIVKNNTFSFLYILVVYIYIMSMYEYEYSYV